MQVYQRPHFEKFLYQCFIMMLEPSSWTFSSDSNMMAEHHIYRKQEINTM